MDNGALKVQTIRSLSSIDAAQWNDIANPPGERFDPFLSWEFLESLESSGAASPETGWQPCHIILRDESENLLAAMPLYVKSHSRGEFVFDYAWADAFERAGGHYYPKLLSAVPFTPVTGRRLLVGNHALSDTYRAALLDAALQMTRENELSSLHINFNDAPDRAFLESEQLLIRTDQQFHWVNNNYECFDDFLSELSSSKRKNLRKERLKANSDLSFVHLSGSDICPNHWDAFYKFYLDTGERKWGTPYLNRDTFERLSDRMSDRILLISAMDGETPIAGALNFIGSDTLYGRYWGCSDARPMLHFETCYYQAIDYAIEHGLKYVEAGAQGGHKLARGYAPVTTYSAHWITHPGLRSAVKQYLDHERDAVERDQVYLNERTPFKKNV